MVRLRQVREWRNSFNRKHASNNSMDVRRKQRLSYQTGLLTFGLRVTGFRPRHLNRWLPRGEIGANNFYGKINHILHFAFRLVRY